MPAGGEEGVGETRARKDENPQYAASAIPLSSIPIGPLITFLPPHWPTRPYPRPYPVPIGPPTTHPPQFDPPCPGDHGWYSQPPQKNSVDVVGECSGDWSDHAWGGGIVKELSGLRLQLDRVRV